MFSFQQVEIKTWNLLKWKAFFAMQLKQISKKI